MHDLLLIWFFIEINNFLFICYLRIKINNKKIIFFYFIIQTLASLLIILSLIYNNLFLSNNFFIINFYIALIIKLRIPPFHLWMPILSFYLNWNIIFFLLTIQKITPFYLFSIIKIYNLIFYYLIISTAFLSTFKIINLLNFKIILIYSSINQTRWILFLILIKTSFWLIYIIIYSLIIFILTSFLTFYKSTFNFFLNNYFSLNFNLIYLIIIINLARIPPLSFFLFKWIRIFILIINTSLHLIFILIIINSFILIYIYINFIISIIFFYSIKFKFINKLIYNINFYKINIPLFFFLSLLSSLLFTII